MECDEELCEFIRFESGFAVFLVMGVGDLFINVPLGSSFMKDVHGTSFQIDKYISWLDIETKRLESMI